MIERSLMVELLQQLKDMAAVAVLGPRQVGKTTLVKMLENKVSRPVIYLDLESPQDQNRLQDPELYFSEREDSLIVLDEIQGHFTIGSNSLSVVNIIPVFLPTGANQLEHPDIILPILVLVTSIIIRLINNLDHQLVIHNIHISL